MTSSRKDAGSGTHRMAPRALERRRKILEVAGRVFAREGYGNTDVQVIADLAKSGKGTIYRYFGNKQELFLATAQATVQWIAEYVAAQLAGITDPADHLRQIARACAEYCEEHPETVEIMIQERAAFRDSVFPTALMFRSDNAGGLDFLVRSAIDSGRFREVNPTAAANAFLDLIFGTIVCGVLGGGRRRLVARVQQAVEIFLEGLLARGPQPAPAHELPES